MIPNDPNKREPELPPENEIKRIEEERVQSLIDSDIDEQKVLHEIHANRGHWDRYWSDNRTQGKDDMDFLIRDQWTSIERGEFQRLFMPALQFNKLFDVFRKTLSEQRKNTPNLQVRAMTGKAKQKDLDLRQSLVETIAYRSRNDVVYQSAFVSSLARGYGAILVDTEYESPKSCKQRIALRRVNDVDRCFWDPRAVEPTKADGNFAGYTSVLSWEEFEATYPNIQRPMNFTDSQRLQDFVWTSKESIIICDYFVKEWKSIKVYELSNGESIGEEEYEELKELHSKAKAHLGKKLHSKLIPNLPEIVFERWGEDYKIMHYRVIQDKILDWAPWPSRHLPVIFVDGDSYYIQDKQYTRSLIYYAKDAQRFLNYLMSNISAQFKNMQRAQWMGTPANVEGQEWAWRNPEAQQGILLANPDPKTQQMPQKVPPSELPQSLFLYAEKVGKDISEIVGSFDPQMTNDNQGMSGIAIQRKQMNASMGSYVFYDNLNRAIEQVGRVILDLQPNITSDNHFISLTTKNKKVKGVTLNEKMPNGEYKNYIEAGEYDVEIEAGPSFAVQKDLAMNLMLQMIQVNPQLFPLVADLLAENFDLENMPQIVERFKTMVPPDILAKENGEPPPPPQPDPAAQMQQLQQQLMQQEMKARQSEIAVREQKVMLDKQKLAIDAERLKQDAQSSILDHHSSIHNAELKYASETARTLTDLHKHHITTQHQAHQTSRNPT